MSNQKTALLLLQGWGLFNKGEIAGFDADHAAELVAKGIAAPAPDQPARTETVTLAVDTQPLIDAAVADALAKAQTDFEALDKALDDRSAVLDQREADLAAREAALEAAAKAKAK